MPAAAVQRTRTSSLSTGTLVSLGLHLAIVLFLVVTFSHPQPLAPPAELANAIAISMEPFRPKPHPKPKEPPKPQTPKNIVTTSAPEPDVQVAQAPAEPSPPSEPEQSAPGAASYAAIVAGILQRNKRYPRDALLSSQEGTVLAYFVINQQGHVIGYRIEQTSGISSLDQEVVSLLKRVRFPPIPTDDGGDPQRREFSLPLVFKIEE